VRVALLDYEMSNLRSAGKALERLGARVNVARIPAEMGAFDAVVLPGDGHFGEAMARLRAAELDRVVVDAAGEGVPILGICIGLQVLFDASEEAPGVDGLGLIPGVVRALRTSAKIPHIGWSEVTWSGAAPIAPDLPDDASTYYFLHSFVCEPEDPDAVWGTAKHGVSFCAAAGTGHICGLQFHPEKSSRDGLRLVERWMDHARAGVA
jgi:glutamine amidotransferase